MKRGKLDEMPKSGSGQLLFRDEVRDGLNCLGSAGNGISFVGLTEKSNEAWLRFELGLSHCG